MLAITLACSGIAVKCFKNLYSQPQFTVWPGLFPPCRVKFSGNKHNDSCENLPCLSGKSLAHPPVSAVNTGSYLKHLKKLLSENERKHKNTVDAIMDCDIESVRKTLYGKLPTLESEHAKIERQIAQEEVAFSTISVPKIKFFLTALKKGNTNDIKYRKTLINIFINKIFL